jgi:hypothetical protein
MPQADSAMRIDDFRFYRLTSTTRPAPLPGQDETTKADARVRGLLTATLAGCHAALMSHDPTGLIAVVWQRLSDGAGIDVLVGGQPDFPFVVSRSSGSVELNYPARSQADAIDGRRLLGAWRSLSNWLRCTAAPRPLGSDERRFPEGRFEDCADTLTEPWVWLVVAEPLAASRLDDELAQLQVRLPLLRARHDSESDRTLLAHYEHRYRELLGARGSGIWHIHVLVGAAHAPMALRNAGMLAAAIDLDTQPYQLVPDFSSATLSSIVASRHGADSQSLGSPFVGDAQLLAALARPPCREMAGFQVREQAEFDLVPDRAAACHGPGENRPQGLELGPVLDAHDRRVGVMCVDVATLNRHGLIVGATGAGKSNTVRRLLTELSRQKIPWLVIEPAKAEYAALPGRVDGLAVLRPGDPDAAPIGFNPLEPEPGFALQTHLDLVGALFLAAFDAVEPFPQVLAHALTRCYTTFGWDTVLGESTLPNVPAPRWPTLGDLRREAMDVVERIGYGREITDNVRGFIDVRLGSLELGTLGRFFNPRYRLDIASLLRTAAVVEIQDIGNDSDKAFFIGCVLLRLYEHLRVHSCGRNPGELRHVLVIEEAHRLLRRADSEGPARHAVELFAAMLAELRAYGQGILVAEQIPTKIAPDVVKNTALKIVHRLPAGDDRELVGAAMNVAEPQSRQLVSLPTGQAVVFTDGMDHPLRVAVPLCHLSRRVDDPCHPAPIGDFGPDERPLTLREIRRAQRIAEDPHLVLWIELLVIAHLVGRRPPEPRPHWIGQLATAHPRVLLGEAVAHLIERAVLDRYRELVRWYAPERLRTHLVDSALGLLDSVGRSPTCDGTETQWQAGRFRWADVDAALHDTRLRLDRPHPDTAAWAERGLPLPGDTVEEQRAALHAHPDLWRPDPSTVLGTGRPPLLAATIALLSRASSPQKRFVEAVHGHLVLSGPWPVALLETADTGVRSGSQAEGTP